MGQDILCQVDKLPPEILNIHSVKVRCNSAYLTIIIPETLLPTFEKAIQKARDISYQEEQRKRFEKYSASILSQFDKLIESGLPVRQAI